MSLSVALCTYNGRRFIAAQVDSILQQTVPVDEIVICDDGSTDGTVAILQGIRAQHPDVITLHISDRNHGALRTFEQCIARCRGDIVFLADQDDEWLPDKVKVMLACFEEHQDALLVFTNGLLIDDEGSLMPGTLWEKWGFTPTLQEAWRNNDAAFDDLVRNWNKVTGATVAFRSTLTKSIFPFRHEIHYWHDAWLALYAAKGHGLHFIDVPLIKYRVHPNQLVGVGGGTTLQPLRESLIQRVYGRMRRMVGR